jgi:hypothetical protein
MAAAARRESGGVCIARFDHFCIWINRPVRPAGLLGV